MRNRAVHFFGNVSMANGHDGLAEIAMKKRVNVDELRAGEFAVFINKAFTAMKLFASNGIVIYWKQPRSKRLFDEVVTTLPHFLSGADIGFSREVTAAIERYYRKHMKKRGDGEGRQQQLSTVTAA